MSENQEFGKMKKRKVLIFLPSSTGGAERVAVTIGKMLPIDEFEVKFVIVSRQLESIVQFIPKEYEVIHLSLRNIWCAATWRMMRIIKWEKPDVVFGSQRYLSGRTILAAHLVDRNIKSIVRMDNNAKTMRWDFKFLLKHTFKYCDCMITQQEEMKAEYEQLLNDRSGKIIALHNPIDFKSIQAKLTAPNPFDDNGKYLKYVWVGRYQQAKGQDLLVKAFEKVHRSMPNAHLYLIGAYDPKSEYFKEIHRFVMENNITDCVHFVGFDNNPYKWVKYCDCFVMPSRLEGLPNALIEAMYIGRPVVATKCIPVVERIVDDGQNGYLAETENVDSIADCMLKAPMLKNVKMTYRPSVDEDFIKLFRA